MTGCTITSIYRKTYFFQERVQFNYELNLLSCNQPVKIISDGVESEVGSEHIIIGNRFEIISTNKGGVTIQGIAFIPKNPRKNTGELYIVRKQDIHYLDVLINISHDSSQFDLPKAQQNLELLWDKLVQQGKIGEPEPISHNFLKGKIDKRLIIVHRYIRQHYGEPLTLQLLADLIHCNPVYLCNSYTKVFRITPMKYHQFIRMKRAGELLNETNMSIKEISIRLGYISNSQFSATFKRYFFCTPLEYRRNNFIIRRRLGYCVETKMKAIDEEISRIVGEMLEYKQPIALEQDLYKFGLNSMKIIALIVQLEEHFNILFNDNELFIENYSNKRDIIIRVEGKLDDCQSLNTTGEV